jgi:hypothetical protein
MATNVTVPSCSIHARASAYTDEAQANFKVTSLAYYKVDTEHLSMCRAILSEHHAFALFTQAYTLNSQLRVFRVVQN